MPSKFDPSVKSSNNLMVINDIENEMKERPLTDSPGERAPN